MIREIVSSLEESQISIDKILILDPAISSKLEQYISVFRESGIIHFRNNSPDGIITRVIIARGIIVSAHTINPTHSCGA